jgi:transporter family-2 protein
LGSIYIIAGIAVPGKIGASSFTGMTVTAAIITSILMDHFGLVGFKQHSAGFARIAGACLMIGGLVLIAKF